jgi:ligand-binding sensor domain-containing protein
MLLALCLNSSVFGAATQVTINPRKLDLSIIDGQDLRFGLLSTADGLSQTKVAQIVQDDHGFLWFGTQFGLNRYDGNNFRVFANEPGNPNSLSGVFVRSLFKDRTGSLWVGCDQYLNKFDAKTESFTHYPVPFVTGISQDSAGTLWLSTGTGLYELNPATGRIHNYAGGPADPSGLSGSDVTQAREDSEGRFWVASTAGIDELDRRTGRVTLHIPVSKTSWGISFTKTASAYSGFSMPRATHYRFSTATAAH